MMGWRWWRWLPWRYLLRRAAHAHGLIDPFAVLARLERFGQPSEVAEPIELLRAGVAFHARGLVNSRAIQHNLDWIWPYWVERQFDPGDDAFLPRAFSITHVNLTHRNWTAIGSPDVDALPLVDPRGLLTPWFDGWSLDAAVMAEDGRKVVPSRLDDVTQRLELGDALTVVTESSAEGIALISKASVETTADAAVCQVSVQAMTDTPAWLVLALRPYNPEGVSPIHEIALPEDHRGWLIEGRPSVGFSEPPDRHQTSNYRQGAESMRPQDAQCHHEHCEVGMASAAAFYEISPQVPRRLTVTVPLAVPASTVPPPRWTDVLAGTCELDIGDPHVAALYQSSLVTLVLLSPDDVHAGPFTYKRFWFRDAAFITHALLCTGFTARAERALDRFPARQEPNGYFRSQEGEWDSNGQALWILGRYCELTGRTPKPQWLDAVYRGARWIARKRLPDGEAPHAGLLPAGFSAEHLGPNDYYYWDDFWGIAGLHAAARMALAVGNEARAAEFGIEAARLMRAVDTSLQRASQRLARAAIPASPYRRMDAGAIGSLAAGYPLALVAPRDERLIDTANYLLDSCLVNGTFFQHVIHSGNNAYLTLHLAQVLLRAGDRWHLDLVQAVADLASATGHWPEAVHPRTGGGCMGDGHHGWASAEWLLMIRNAFVREENEGLIIGSGVPVQWCRDGARFGPAPTRFGAITVHLSPVDADLQQLDVSWSGDWHRDRPAIEVMLPDYRSVVPEPGAHSVRVERHR